MKSIGAAVHGCNAAEPDGFPGPCRCGGHGSGQPAPAHALPFGEAVFDGVIAVNCAQLFAPPGASRAELSRVTVAGGRLVTLTHDWAVRRHGGSVEAWLGVLEAAARDAGFDSMERWQGRALTGGTVGFAAIHASARAATEVLGYPRPDGP